MEIEPHFLLFFLYIKKRVRSYVHDKLLNTPFQFLSASFFQ